MNKQTYDETSPMKNSDNGKLPAHEAPITHVQPPRREDLQPTFAYVIKPDVQDAAAHGWYGSFIDIMGRIVGTIGAIPCTPCPNPYKEVQQGTVGLVTKFGRFARAVDPGLVKINPLSEKLKAIDVKIQIVGM